ncbi:Rod binding protein [Helicobacter anatolicus]|uniref:Rod binding protein n=1 Tax=Helicobacter anatolicus TaxID=2905874 RepID=UPI001E42631E|nr:Rod binding protein [Helicobacter anatolicus]MCE3037786.1 Rod binding protein [Helicobacter anatolicus]MCE3039898.1 Rod binding protein [Helicobacter anatolicus]
MASVVNKNLKPNLNASDEKLKEQTDAFESLILKTLLDTALKLENPLYPKEAGNEIYQSMYKDTLANNLSGSFGYSQLLFDFLKEQQAGKR